MADHRKHTSKDNDLTLEIKGPMLFDTLAGVTSSQEVRRVEVRGSSAILKGSADSGARIFSVSHDTDAVMYIVTGSDRQDLVEKAIARALCRPLSAAAVKRIREARASNEVEVRIKPGFRTRRIRPKLKVNIAGLQIARPDFSPTAEIEQTSAQKTLSDRWYSFKLETIKNYPFYTSAEVSELSGSSASNKAARASVWYRNGLIFKVNDGTRDLFPAFQFKEGRPIAALTEILPLLNDKGSEWETMAWFISPNERGCGGRKPADILASEPEIVIQAAKNEALEAWY